MLKPNLLIILSILQSIKVSLVSKPLDYDNRFYWAAICLGCFGSLHCWEFIMLNVQVFNLFTKLAKQLLTLIYALQASS